MHWKYKIEFLHISSWLLIFVARSFYMVVVNWMIFRQELMNLLIGKFVPGKIGQESCLHRSWHQSTKQRIHRSFAYKIHIFVCSAACALFRTGPPIPLHWAYILFLFADFSSTIHDHWIWYNIRNLSLAVLSKYLIYNTTTNSSACGSDTEIH